MKTLSKRHTEAIEKAKTEQGKVKAAALAMIETPMDLIKAVLLKHEEAVIEVMCELHQQQQADEALLRQVLEALEPYADIKPRDWKTDREKLWRSYDALRAALAEDAMQRLTDVQQEMEQEPEHITDGRPCWCEPELDYKDPETGAEVWVHRRAQ